MTGSLHPAALLLVGALVVPFVRGWLRTLLVVLLPLAGFANLLGLEAGTTVHLGLAGFDLHVVRVDKLSLLFGYLFHLAAFIAAVYSIHVHDDGLQPTTGLHPVDLR